MTLATFLLLHPLPPSLPSLPSLSWREVRYSSIPKGDFTSLPNANIRFPSVPNPNTHSANQPPKYQRTEIPPQNENEKGETGEYMLVPVPFPSQLRGTPLAPVKLSTKHQNGTTPRQFRKPLQGPVYTPALGFPLHCACANRQTDGIEWLGICTLVIGVINETSGL